jgi:hypothetical protein
VAFLTGVTQARQPDVEPLRAQQIQEPADAGRASERDDGDALRTEGAAVTRSQSVQRHLVADPFDEYGRAQGCAGSQFVCGRGGCWSPRTAGRPLRDRQTEPPYRIHGPQSLSLLDASELAPALVRPATIDDAVRSYEKSMRPRSTAAGSVPALL